MTLVNIPFLFWLHGAAVCGIYGFIGAGAWGVGRTWRWPRVDALGRSLVWASGGTLLGYTGILVVWMVLVGVGGVQGLDLGVAFLYLMELLPLIPPVWALLRYSGADDTEGEPPGPVPQE